MPEHRGEVHHRRGTSPARHGVSRHRGARRTRAAGLGLAACLMAATGCAPRPVPATPPAEVVRAFFGALDRHDAEGVLEVLHQDFTFRSADGSFAIGRDALPHLLAWDFAAGSDVVIERLEAQGDTVRVALRERNRFTELLGLEPWRVEARFVVRDGRIREEVAREVVGEGPSFESRFRRALEPVAEWAAEVRPADAESVFADGGVARYDGPTARRLLRLLEAYRQRADGGSSSEPSPQD